MVSATTIKELRERSGAGIMDCRNALLETAGDIEKAIHILEKKGIAKATKVANRETTQGLIEAYIHFGGRIGAMVEVNCETDFVARTDEFKQLAHDLAMQVAATSPLFVSKEEMPQSSNLNAGEACLLPQPFIKNPDKTIEDIITEIKAKMGENIVVRRFARFELGC